MHSGNLPYRRTITRDDGNRTGLGAGWGEVDRMTAGPAKPGSRLHGLTAFFTKGHGLSIGTGI
jgi:hypothetical protein